MTDETSRALLDALNISPTLSTPLYQQIYDRLRAAILAGQIQSGTRLPSTRALATALGVSRNTVLNAYDQLLAEGYLNSREGSGTVVASLLPETLLATQTTQQPPARSSTALPLVDPGLSARG